jgi:multiple sugar transport system substrate-binding protein
VTASTLLVRFLTRGRTLAGGTGPTRTSVYDDPRVLANAKVGAGTTRHLPIVR